MPFATSSPLVMPPKMLMKIERTLASLTITPSAPAITSALAPPPMSRKLAGLPPTWFTMSTVLIASPAPLAMTPTEPSRPDVLQALLVRELLARVADLGGVVVLVVGVTEDRVVVERDLGVERVHVARPA